jgi:hypothetical protein
MATTESYREIVEFLVDPKNLEGAFDLIDVFPIALDRLHAKFWDTLKTELEPRVKKREAPWVVRLVADEREDAEGVDFLKRGDSHLEVLPANSDEMPLYCSFLIEQEYRTSARKQVYNDHAQLLYGFGFTKPLTKREQTNLPKEAKALISPEWTLRRGQLADGWLACKKLHYELRARHETIRLAQGNSLEEDIGTALLKLFDERREAVERINAAFRKSRARSAR